MTPTLLLVDDDPSFVQDLSDLLVTFMPDAKVLTATSGAAALDMLKVQPIDLIISDRHMPGMDGLELLRAARAHDPTMPRILMTGDLTFDTVMAAVAEARICEVIAKPPQASTTMASIRRLLGLRASGQECSPIGAAA
ncbi:MAG: response regulator [bacterium]